MSVCDDLKCCYLCLFWFVAGLLSGDVDVLSSEPFFGLTQIKRGKYMELRMFPGSAYMTEERQ